MPLADTASSSDRPRRHRLRLKLTLAGVLSPLILAWLSWDAYSGYRYAQAQLLTTGRMEATRAEIRRLDEVLTMSARMAAASGDLEWERRYREFEPQLDRSIKEALRLDPSAFRGAAADKVDAANIALVALEHRGFELVRQGNDAEAQRLLSSTEYEAHKKAYAAGMTELDRHLSQAIDSRRAELLSGMRRSAVTTITSALLLILGSLLVFRATRRWQAIIVDRNERLNHTSAKLGESHERLDEKVRELNESVRQHQLATARAEYLASYDDLTALPNRSMFSWLLNQAISRARRHDKRLAVLFVDLDRFKSINDTLGHEAGDLLLQEVGRRLRGCLRESDTVARLGGDEFVVLLSDLDDENLAAVAAQKILFAVARPFLLLGHEFRVTASVGISNYPQDGLDEQTLTKNADIAMYLAKEEGKNNYQFYSEKLNANPLERLSLELGLRRALERSEFQLYYQAKQDVQSGRITGTEALLRWQHPDLGTLLPMRFIPLAEETGLIVPIGKWVLKTACLQILAWQQQGLPRLSMAVNLTPRQFSDERLLPDLVAILADTGIDAHLLELEINESLLMRDVDRAMRILTGLKDMGIRLAIDDFGSGYFSLSTLAKLPLDTIKIARSFIRDIASVGDDRDLTEAIIAMGRTLSLTVVAQGVETKEQAEYLRQNACDEFQGFYLNRPLPADQISELLRAQRDAEVGGAERVPIH